MRILFLLRSGKNDKNGCKNIRESLYPDFTKVQDKLVGLAEKEVMGILGYPDRVELYQKAQRFYIYYLSKGAQCDSTHRAQHYIRIRFELLGGVDEVTLNVQ